MVTIIYGPPGIGKSELAHYFSSWMGSIDMEFISPVMRKVVASNLPVRGKIVVSAADTEPKDYKQGNIHVGLRMGIDEYKKDRLSKEGKIEQLELDKIKAWFDGMDRMYDKVIDIKPNSSVADVAKLISQVLHESGLWD